VNTPTRRTRSTCCALDATGQAAAPPRIPRNSRRLMSVPKLGMPIVPAQIRTGKRTTKCPLWVKSRHRSVSAQCPLYPRKRTFDRRRGMSALCQKQTSADLFDHLVGQHEEVVWHFDPERPRGGEIDDEIKFGRLLDWEIAGLGPAQNLVDILGGAAE
jgi:hypothetical protein